MSEGLCITYVETRMYDADNCCIELRNHAGMPEPALAWTMPDRPLGEPPLMLGADQRKQILPELIPQQQPPALFSAAKHKG